MNKWICIVFIFLSVVLASCVQNTNEKKKTMLIPVVSSEWWSIGPSPDLSNLNLQPSAINGVQANQPNDHTIFIDKQGKWHLWACVRQTAVGRVLCHWTADSLEQTPWKFTEEVIRADKSAGESLVEWKGQEFLQSPYVISMNHMFYMFYGGYDSGLDRMGNPTTDEPDYSKSEKQICLMTSEDGLHWNRYRNDSGCSRLFTGPGAARDINIVRFKNSWYAYYCGHHNMDRTNGAIYVRKSSDLIHWTDWKIAHYDKRSEGKEWLPESPAVVYRSGYYYLFRSHGPEGGVYVFRSEDPENFGIGNTDEYFVCRLEGVLANEIITDDRGNEYISNILDGNEYGICLASLNWHKEQ